MLEEAGVVFKSATEPFDTSTSMGKFLFQLLGSMAELDRATLLERMNLGRDRLASVGKWLHGPIRFGYTVTSAGLLTPSLRLVAPLGITEAEFVRDLFQRIAAGSSATRESARLTALGVATTRYYSNGATNAGAGYWSSARILHLLRNAIYRGSHTVHSRFGAIERDVPPLVSPLLWEQANAQIAGNQRLPKSNATTVYTLRGLIICGRCGRRYVGSRRHGNRRRPSYAHRCGGRRPGDAPTLCTQRRVAADQVEAAVWDRCKWFVQHPQETLVEVERLLTAHLTPDRTVAPTEQEVLQQLVAKDDEERLLLSVLRRGQVRLAAFEQKMAHLNQERGQLQRQLHALRSQQKTVDALEEYYQRIRDRLQRWEAQLPGIEQTDARELKRELMADLVDRIVVEDTETVVYYRFTAQQEVVALLPMSWRN